MKRKALIPLVLGLVIGLATVKMLVDFARKAQAGNQNKQTVKAIRAKQDIGAYEGITPDMVEVVETGDSLFAPAGDRIESVDGVADRVAAKAIPQNAAVLKSMLAPEGTRPGMVGRIPAGFRAVSVKIDEVTGVSYQLKPGDWVDVIVVMDVDSPTRGKKDTVAEVILQHVQIAAIGYAAEAQVAGPGGGSKVKPAKSASLLVPEEEVPKLHLAATKGKITLAMRGEDDTDKGSNPFAHSNDLFASSKPPSPKPSGDSGKSKIPNWLNPGGSRVDPLMPHTILLYKGSPTDRSLRAMEQVTFENAASSKIVDISIGPPTRTLSTMTPQRLGRPMPSAPASDSAAPGSQDGESAAPAGDEDAESDEDG